MATFRKVSLFVVGVCTALGITGCGKPKDAMYYSQHLDEAKARQKECEKKGLESLNDPECNASGGAIRADVEQRMKEAGNRAAQRLRERPMPTFGFGPAPDQNTK